MTNGAWTVPANIVPVDEESPRKGIKILVGAAGRPSATFSTRACPRWQAVISVDTCLGDHGRLEWVALFARQAMVVAGRVHEEATVYRVVDVCLFWGEL